MVYVQRWGEALREQLLYQAETLVILRACGFQEYQGARNPDGGPPSRHV